MLRLAKRALCKCNLSTLVIALLALQLYLTLVNFRTMEKLQLTIQDEKKSAFLVSNDKTGLQRSPNTLSELIVETKRIAPTKPVSKLLKAALPDRERTETVREVLLKQIFAKESRNVNDEVITQTDCRPRNHRLFPLCKEKFDFIKHMYGEIRCLKDVHKIDGSDCSVLRYLQNIEPYCLQDNNKNIQDTVSETSQKKQIKSKMKTDLSGVLSLLSLKDFDWLRKRIRSKWPDWREAAILLKSNQHLQEGSAKKILIYLGSMDYQPYILKNAGKGGYVGELVQWTDLIASSYILGHDVKVVLNGTDLKALLQPDENECASKSIPSSRVFDIIFTDINGFVKLRNLGTSNFARLRCKLRILDSFGTEAEFNYHAYDEPIPAGKSGWGSNDLILQQFLTYLPHSPDNSFLGFAAGSGKMNYTYVKKNQAVIYGKNDYYIQGMLPYLDIIKDYFEIHATMHVTGNYIPSYVINHGVVTVADLKILLARSKVFIGLGFPFEGPGPLEAISSGAVFLNPKFIPPKDKFNDAFFRSKPNLRKLTSQNPYMEDFVGEPYVYTIDFNDKEALKNTLKKLKRRQTFRQYLPREFTNIGMLERLHAFIQHQNFCDGKASRWPPLESLEIYLAAKGVSCKLECRKKGKICEPSYFTDINEIDSFKRLGISCNKTKTAKKLYHPSYDTSTGECYFQDHIFYFSCVAQNANVSRLCPCRTFQKGQTALCRSCL